MERRPIASRNTSWAHAVARLLTRSGLSPNQISVLSVGFAGLATFACYRYAGTIDHAGTSQPLWLLLMAVAIQLRLLCNLFDGMVAVEGGKGTPTGPLFNELPDRLADLLIIVPLGYLIPTVPYGVELGWAAGAAAVLTAYIRALGGSVGAPQIFAGVLGKSQRMAVITVAGVLAVLPPLQPYISHLLAATLVIVLLGSLLTCWQRLRLIARHLHHAAH
ncbi:MAG: CDP-alcohol phosphatidyltransferase family protein [Pseudomonadota bacterium]